MTEIKEVANKMVAFFNALLIGNRIAVPTSSAEFGLSQVIFQDLAKYTASYLDTVYKRWVENGRKIVVDVYSDQRTTNIIYTHNVAMDIVEMMEDALCGEDIKVPSPEDDERDPDNEAGLYGSTDADLLEKIENELVALLSIAKDGYHRGVLGTKVLGIARFIDLGNQKPDIARKKNEIFFSVKHPTKGIAWSLYGYMTVTEEMQKIFDTLFRDNPQNRNIEFIEWDNCINCVFHDGICISSAAYAIDKDDFNKYILLMQDYQDMMENGIHVPCTCSACGRTFAVKYHVDGSYEYVNEPCDCEADFEPVDGDPSISEWLERVKQLKEDIANGKVCVWP